SGLGYFYVTTYFPPASGNTMIKLETDPLQFHPATLRDSLPLEHRDNILKSKLPTLEAQHAEDRLRYANTHHLDEELQRLDQLIEPWVQRDRQVANWMLRDILRRRPDLASEENLESLRRFQDTGLPERDGDLSPTEIAQRKATVTRVENLAGRL